VSVPKGHVNRLTKELAGHKHRLSQLRESIRIQQEEMRLHETVVRLGQDTHLLAALGELYDDPELVTEVSRNPRDYFERKGVVVPQDAKVEVTNSSPQATRIEARIEQGPYRYTVTWERRSGFSLEATAAPSRPPETTFISEEAE
jgi:hypothetical protein